MSATRCLARLSIVFAAAVFATGCATSEDSESGPTSVETPTEVAITDPAELMLSLAQAWDDADWEAMASFSYPSVVEVGKEWRDANGSVNITQENVAEVLESCSVPGAGVTRCQFTYNPPEGFALIFDATYESTDDGLKLTDLQFAGDAG